MAASSQRDLSFYRGKGLEKKERGFPSVVPCLFHPNCLHEGSSSIRISCEQIKMSSHLIELPFPPLSRISTTSGICHGGWLFFSGFDWLILLFFSRERNGLTTRIERHHITAPASALLRVVLKYSRSSLPLFLARGSLFLYSLWLCVSISPRHKM